MAEIEHFCDPEDKSHPKFESVCHTPVSFITLFHPNSLVNKRNVVKLIFFKLCL